VPADSTSSSAAAALASASASVAVAIRSRSLTLSARRLAEPASSTRTAAGCARSAATSCSPYAAHVFPTWNPATARVLMVAVGISVGLAGCGGSSGGGGTSGPKFDAHKPAVEASARRFVQQQAQPLLSVQEGIVLNVSTTCIATSDSQLDCTVLQNGIEKQDWTVIVDDSTGEMKATQNQ
jgi:hypothetical protein